MKPFVSAIRHAARRAILVIALVANAALGVVPAIAQQTGLTITAPSDGTSVAPGQTVTVAVDVGPSMNATHGILVIGEGPVGAAGPVFTQPFSFSLAVPRAITPDRYAIRAVGVDAGGKLVSSPVVHLDVEPTEAVAGLQAEPTNVRLRFRGDQFPLRVIGTLPDGSTVDLTRSTRTTYAAADSGLVNVDVPGVVTAVGAGPAVTTVMVGYGDIVFGVPVSLPPMVVGDLDGNGVVDVDDLNVLLDVLETPPGGAFDGRDLDGNGRIDLRDAQILAEIGRIPLPPTDTTPPVTVAQPLPAANANGWNNETVTVSLSATDEPGGSGVRDISFQLTGAQTATGSTAGSAATVTISAEGITTLRYFAHDDAGNEEPGGTLVIQIDRTPPTLTAVPNTPPNTAGWHNRSVTVSFDAADTLSGLATVSPPLVVSTEGAGQTISGFATDRAGNSSTASLTLNIDSTPPAIGGLPPEDCALWPPNGRLVPVAAIVATDTLSGLQPVDLTIHVTSSEPASKGRDVIIDGTTIFLRSQRSGGGTGRSYTINVTAGDVADNIGHASSRCIVPHDQRR